MGSVVHFESRRREDPWRGAPGAPPGLGPDHEDVARGVAGRLGSAVAAEDPQALWRTTIDALDDLVFTVDRELRIVLCNQAVERQLAARGLPRPAVGRRLLEVFGYLPADAPQAYETVFATGVSEVLETEVCEQGQSTWWDVRRLPIRGTDGTVTAVLTVARDVTARRAAEQATARSEQQHCLLSEQLMSGYVLFEALYDHHGQVCDLRLLNANPMFETLLGLPVAESVGRTATQLVPALERRWLLRVARVAQNGHRDQFELYSPRFGRWFEVRTYSPAPGQVAAIFNDTDERRRAAEERERLNKQLRQAAKMEVVGQLAGGIIHDFNNLLTAICGYSEFLLDKLPADHPQRHDLLQVRQAGDRAAALTRQLLGFGRLRDTKPEVVEPNRVVAGVEPMLRRIIGEDIDLVVSLEPEAPEVELDASQLEQVLLNLTVNSRAAMPCGGHLRIATEHRQVADEAGETGSLRPGRYAVLSVTDSGCGMDALTVSRVFEPFFTTKAEGEGTGLGLSVVANLAAQWGGQVTCDSAPGCGATFRLWIPAAAGGPGQAPAPPDGGRPAAVHSGRVLLVEDEPFVLDLTQRALEQAGFAVLAAASAGEAFELLDQHRDAVDLMLTDVVMPGMDGCELALQVRGLAPAMPVLFMSGYSEPIVARRGLLTHDNLLVKPFSPATLVQRVREALVAG